MTDEKKVSFDIDGSEAVSKVLLELLNTFPGLGEKKIRFSTLSDSSGIGFFPTSGAAIQSQKEDITGHVKQECLYPFRVVYRAAPKREEQKLKIKEFLDSLGKWLEQLSVTEFPPLSAGNRYFERGADNARAP